MRIFIGLPRYASSGGSPARQRADSDGLSDYFFFKPASTGAYAVPGYKDSDYLTARISINRWLATLRNIPPVCAREIYKPEACGEVVERSCSASLYILVCGGRAEAGLSRLLPACLAGRFTFCTRFYFCTACLLSGKIFPALSFQPTFGSCLSVFD